MQIFARFSITSAARHAQFMGVNAECMVSISAAKFLSSIVGPATVVQEDKATESYQVETPSIDPQASHDVYQLRDD